MDEQVEDNIPREDPQIQDMLSQEESSQEDQSALANQQAPMTEEELKSLDAEEGSELTYSKQYYMLNRDEILAKRREKELEAKFGDFSARLVKRPKKNFMWGYGTQMHEEGQTDQEFFTEGQLPTIRQLINFLEVYQMKDIQVVNLERLGRSQEKFGIVCSGFSARHLFSTAKKLKEAVNKLNAPELQQNVKVHGSKSDSWLLVVVKEVQVHFLLEEYRYELDLEFRWLNEPPLEMHKKWKLYEKLKRRSDTIDHRAETFQTDEADQEER